MNELDKMMSCLGFNETTVKTYGNAIPFTSRKLDIINRINRVGLENTRTSDSFALFYIFSIAFLVMVMRCLVFTPSGDATVMTVLTSIVFHYGQEFQNSLNVISFLISIVICVGTGVMINHLKNETHFC